MWIFFKMFVIIVILPKLTIVFFWMVGKRMEAEELLVAVKPAYHCIIMSQRRRLTRSENDKFSIVYGISTIKKGALLKTGKTCKKIYDMCGCLPSNSLSLHMRNIRKLGTVSSNSWLSCWQIEYLIGSNFTRFFCMKCEYDRQTLRG